MLGILKTILGSGDVISKGMDLLDDMHTSKEEEIEAKNKAKVNLLGAYAPFKIAQRFLAMVFSTTFLLAFFLVLGMTLAGKGNTEDVMEVLGMFYIGEIMLAIILFYFGGGFAEGAIGKFKQKAEAA